MITVKPAEAKNFFFDRKIVEQFMDKKTASALARGGGFVQKIAQSSMRSRKKASPPGTPPSRHGRRGRGLTHILFVFDPKTKSVIVGPVVYRSLVNADSTTAPQANEFGGTVRIRVKRATPHTFVIGERGPVREKGQPSPRSKRFARPILRTQEQVDRAQKIHDDYVVFRNSNTNQSATYPQRAFMGPALEKAKPKLPSLWTSAVQQ